MEATLTMTQLNDFIFCPRSLYYNGIFRQSVDTDVYHQTPQKTGLAAHAAVDEGRYSTRGDVLQGTMVYCARYALLGRIDVFDAASGVLTERKHSITAVYDGFRYQLYAQYFALMEMGYAVNQLRLYSSKTNKVFPVALPGAAEVAAFEDLLEQMRTWTPDRPFTPNGNKCRACIYNSLCDAWTESD